VLLTSLRNFIAEITAAYSTRNRRQRAPISAADLAAKNAANHCTHADADWTIVRYRCRYGLLIRRLRILNRLSLRHRGMVNDM